ncbi:unnamed protein product [Parnassius apollo]|uniref:(apollo) hypothetical protein n=1 Tax=Parnassius apollo TaxID=110799 RepID=A0A8S3X0T0_PARAO|nr:unnamed protein product [Parnassius apollo]
MSGTAPSDKRGKSGSNKILDNNIKDLICNHIKSFKGRQSHYSLNDTKKEYLPEDLNIKKMYKLYLDAYEPQNHVYYETYRIIFNTEINISFDYPRTDTCSACDEFKIKAKALRAEGNIIELNRLTILNNLRKKKAQTFYDLPDETDIFVPAPIYSKSMTMPLSIDVDTSVQNDDKSQGDTADWGDYTPKLLQTPKSAPLGAMNKREEDVGTSLTQSE